MAAVKFLLGLVRPFKQKLDVVHHLGKCDLLYFKTMWINSLSKFSLCLAC